MLDILSAFRIVSTQSGEAQSRDLFHKSRYVRIQALSLAETGRENFVRVALKLLSKLFAEFPDDSQLASAHLLAARCHEHLGNVPDAVAEFRLALNAQAARRSIDPGTALEFPWFIVTHELSELYGEALQLLEAAHLAFPVQVFKAAAIRAFIAESRRDHLAAHQNAKEALLAGAATQSQFRYHRTLGLVDDGYQSVIERLRKLATAQPAAAGGGQQVLESSGTCARGG
jgi:tetratricopeptide (TPR) repeat protein